MPEPLDARAKAALVIFSQAFSAVCSAAALVLAGRLVDPRAFGIFLFSWGVLGILPVLTDMGTSLAHQRAVAGGASREEALSVLVRLRAGLGALVAVAALGAWLVGGRLAAARFGDVTTWPVFAVALAAQLLAIARSLVEATWVAQQRPLVPEAMRTMENVGLLVALGGLWAVGVPAATRLLGAGLAMQGGALLLASCFAGAKVLPLGTALLAARRDRLNLARPARSLQRSMARQAGPLGLVFLMGSLVLTFDTLALGWWWDAAEVAQYGAAQRVAMLCTLPAAALSTLLVPRHAQLQAGGHAAVAELTSSHAQRYLALLTVPVVTVVVTVPQVLTRAAFGAEYERAASALRWMGLWALANIMAQPLAARLMGEGRLKLLGGAVGINLVLNAAFNVVLVPPWPVGLGAVGAGIASAVSTGLAYLWLRGVLRPISRPASAPRAWRLLVATVVAGAAALAGSAGAEAAGLGAPGTLVLCCFATLLAFAAAAVVVRLVVAEDWRMAAATVHRLLVH